MSAGSSPRTWVFVGLTITSSWGNGHATTYRALLRALAARGHEVLFLERDLPCYARERDLVSAPWARVEIHQDLADLRARFTREVQRADAVVIGSYVPEGIAVGEWILDRRALRHGAADEGHVEDIIDDSDS